LAIIEELCDQFDGRTFKSKAFDLTTLNINHLYVHHVNAVLKHLIVETEEIKRQVPGREERIEKHLSNC
jgi:hypothetical protein